MVVCLPCWCRVRTSTKGVSELGKIFSKPAAPDVPVMAAAPAPSASNATEDSKVDNSLTKKKRGKSSLMATPVDNGNTGVNL